MIRAEGRCYGMQQFRIRVSWPIGKLVRFDSLMALFTVASNKRGATGIELHCIACVESLLNP